jgi:hypothetical protein
VYKPRGMTPYGWRKEQEQPQQSPSIPATTPDRGRDDTGGDTVSTPRWMNPFAILVISLVLLFVILHLAGGGVGGMHRP